jgi:outer membrane murein-binding lipoprotein Lpp
MFDKMTRNFKLLLICGTVFVAGCTTDKDIEADITQKAKNDMSFAGVSFAVENKIVRLSGNCASIKASEKVLQAVKDINVIKGVINNVQISPVVLNDDFPLQQAADSVLAAFPGAEAHVKDHAITLSGNATKKDIDRLTAGVKRLNAAQLTINLTEIHGSKEWSPRQADH